MPQIAQLAATYASQVFWMLVIFALIYFGIGRAMLPRIQGTVDAREGKVSGDLSAAQQARAEADTLQARWQAELAQARATAQARAADAKALATADAERRAKEASAADAARVAAAEADLNASRAAALANIEGVAAEAAADIVAKLSGRPVSSDQAAAAVRASLL